jgi:hypothetical protein
MIQIEPRIYPEMNLQAFAIPKLGNLNHPAKTVDYCLDYLPSKNENLWK